MTPKLRTSGLSRLTLGFLAIFAAASLTFTALAQKPRSIASAAKVAETRTRDLAAASPESVGMSPNGCTDWTPR